MAKPTGITKPNSTRPDENIPMRKFLYIFYIPLILIEWAVTVIFNLVEVIANAIRDLTLSLKQYINAEAKPVDTSK